MAIRNSNYYMNSWKYNLNSYQKYSDNWKSDLNLYKKYLPATPNVSSNYEKIYNRNLDFYEEYYKKSNALEPDKGRGVLDRAFDMLQFANYAVAGGLRGAIRDDKTVLEGIGEGLRAANPFGEGYEQGEHTFSRVLDDAGWKPESTAGKVARGALGLALDILLDPTTYLSGGLVPLFKGTGKVAAKVGHADLIADISKKYGKDISKGMDIETAKRIIIDSETSKAITINGVEKKRTMLNVITNSDNSPMSKADFYRNAEKLANTYNTLLGINKKSGDLTFGLKNLPFGDKIFKNASEPVTLVKSDKLKAFGDATLSKPYSKLRDAVFGSKLAHIIPTADLYKASKTNPEAVYHKVAMFDSIRGLNVSKNAMKAMVKAQGEDLFGLTPAENKEVLDLLQNPYKWRRVTEMVNISETKKGKEIYNETKLLADKEAQAVRELEDELNLINHALEFNDGKKALYIDELEDLKKQYTEKIMDIKASTLDAKSYENYITILTKEAERIKKEDLPKFLNDESDELVGKVEEIDTKIKDLKEALKSYGEKFVKTKVKDSESAVHIKSEMIKIQEEIHQLQNLNNVDVNIEKYSDIIETYDNYLNDIKINKLSKSKDDIGAYTNQQKIEFCKSLSKALSGNENFIGHSTYDNHLETLMKLMKAGRSTTSIMEFIENNKEFYDGTASFMFSTISDILEKYKGKSFKEYYKGRSDILNKPTLSSADKRKLAEMEDIRLKRNYLLSLCYDSNKKIKSYDAINEILIDYVERKWLASIGEASEHIFPAEYKKSVAGLSEEQELLFNKASMNNVRQKNKGKKYREKPVDAPGMNKPMNSVTKIMKEKMLGSEKYAKALEKIQDNKTTIASPKEVNKYYQSVRERLGRTRPSKEDWKFDPTVDLEFGSVLSDYQRSMVKDDIVKKLMKARSTGKLVTKIHQKYVNQILNEVENIIKENSWCCVFLNKTNSGQMDFDVVDWAIDNVMHNRTAKKVPVDKLLKKTIEESGKRIDETISDYIHSKVTKGYKVDFVHDTTSNVRHTGIVEEVVLRETGKPLYVIKSGNEAYTIDASKFINLYQNRHSVSVQSLVFQSELTKKNIQAINGLTEKLTELSNKYTAIDLMENLKELKKQRKKEISKLKYREKNKAINEARQIEYDTKIADIEKRIESSKNELTESQKRYVEKMKELRENHSRNVSERYKLITEHERKINLFNASKTSLEADLSKTAQELTKLEDALSSMDAFDNYVRRVVKSDAEVDDMILNEYDDLVKITLRSDDEYSEKVRDTAIFLRNKFADIGRQEVEIGKMKPVQFQQLMMEYVAHIPTEMGEKYLSGKNQEIIKKIENFNLEYGFGRNYSPYSKSRTITVLPDGKGGWIERPTIEQINDYFRPMLKGHNLFSDSIAEIYLQRMNKHADLMYDDELMHTMLERFGKDLSGDLVAETGYKVTMNFGMVKEKVRDFTMRKLALNKSEHITNMLERHVDENGNELLRDSEDDITFPIMKFISERARKNALTKITSDMSEKEIKRIHKLSFRDEIQKEVEKIIDDTYEIERAKTTKIVGELAEKRAITAIQRISKYYGSKIDRARKYEEIYEKEFNSLFDKEYKKQKKIRDKEVYENQYKYIAKKIGVSENLEQYVTPLIEMDIEQTIGFNKMYDDIKQNSFENVRKKIISFEAARKYEKMMESGIYEAGLKNKIRKQIEMDCPDIDTLKKYINDVRSGVDELDNERIDGYIRQLDDLIAMPKPQIKQVHETLVNKLNQSRKIQIAKDNSDMLLLFDKMTHLIKLNQTTVLPSFHMRNKYSNMFNNWLVIGRDALNKENQIHAINAMRYEGKAEKLDGSVIKILNNRDVPTGEMSWSELYQKALDYGVVDEGFFAKDLGVGRDVKGKLPVQPKYDPTDTKNFFLYKKGAEIGGIIENSDRLIHFMSQLKHGMSFDDAAMSVERTLFDYGDLTAFEQSTLKRIIPYYTWLRKNSQLQLEMMLEKPKKYMYVSKFMNGIQGMNDEEDLNDRDWIAGFAKDWVQTPFSVTNPAGREESVLWNPNLPFMDLSKIPDPLNPKDSLTELFTQTNPLLKLPIEQVLNRNYFFDSKIVTKDDNALENVKKRLGHASSAISPINIVSDFGKKRGIDLGLHTFNTFGGVKFLSYDYDQYKRIKMQEMYEEMYEEKTGINKLIDAGYTTVTDGFNDAVSSAVRGISNVVMKDRPKKASEYTGALRPISQAIYNRLPESEKVKYLPPNKNEVAAYNKKAVALEAAQLAESGKASKFIWSLFENKNLGDRNQKFIMGNVSSVYDGDTFTVDMGNGQDMVEVRMLLIDTPESVKSGVIEQPGSKMASQYTKKALITKDVKIIFDKSETDTYGRMLGYIELDGVDFNEKLLEEGLAKTSYKFEPPYQRANKYTRAQKKAYNENKGVWNIPNYTKPNYDSSYQTYYDEALVRQMNKMMK